jgi:hypothetical protein
LSVGTISLIATSSNPVVSRIIFMVARPIRPNPLIAIFAIQAPFFKNTIDLNSVFLLITRCNEGNPYQYSRGFIRYFSNVRLWEMLENTKVLV